MSREGDHLRCTSFHDFRRGSAGKPGQTAQLYPCAARGEKGYRAAMLRERVERFAVHVKAELLAERKLKRAQ